MRHLLLPFTVFSISLVCVAAATGRNSSRLLLDTETALVLGGQNCNAQLLYSSCYSMGSGCDPNAETEAECGGSCGGCNGSGDTVQVINGSSVEAISGGSSNDGCGEMFYGPGGCEVNDGYCECIATRTGTGCFQAWIVEYNSDCIPGGS